ncbi:MAG: S1 RNA-binding domain-containing protein [Ruminococcus callidus]|nr:S1 RNA-binding domain-containing protein [Ruminococcus callidus]
MNLEKGKVYSGTVKNITNFGAFVDIYSEDNSRDKATGMVHISEVADDYVKDIHDFLKEGQKVNIVVLGKNENGKYSFSIKKALTDNREEKTERKSEPKQNNFREKKQTESKPEPKDEFEAMMSHFKRISEDKMCDINRIRDRRNNSRRSK